MADIKVQIKELAVRESQADQSAEEASELIRTEESTLVQLDCSALAIGKAKAALFYSDRAFDRLPELGEALEEVGCRDPDILLHCRARGPHVRGCWVVDLLLGKE